MTRLWFLCIALVGALVLPAQSDPTSTSLSGLTLFNNPDCESVPRHWQWPLPPDACHRATVLSILGERELAPAVRPFSYVTGHTDPATGREFALVSAINGLVIVDAHVISEFGPTRLVPDYWVLLDSVQAVHRGTASFGEYVYESNAFRPTLRVARVDVVPGPTTSVSVTQLPDVPLPAIGTSYRLTVDRERGHLYVPTINGLFIYDVNGSNGAAPQLLAVWKGWLPGGGIVPSFDVHLQRDGGTTRAIVSEYLSTAATHISILDVTNLPVGSPPVDPWTPTNWCAFIAGLPMSGAAHSAWMTDDGRYLYSSLGDVVTIPYDMQGFAFYNANRVLTVSEGPPRVPLTGSNPTSYVTWPQAPMRQMAMLGIGYTAYVSSWEEGLVVYDARPDNPEPNQILASVDTCFSSSTQPYGGPTWYTLYPGAFAVHRSQDSGVIYVSDETNGLYLVRLNVGHMHRYGQGVGELHNGEVLVPRIVANHAPPREYPGWNPDPDQRLTVENLVPGRAVLVLAGTEGRATPLPFPTAAGPCLNYLGGFITQTPIFLTADATGRADIALPPGLPEQFRLFVQAWAFLPTTTTCTASTRGTFFGFARQQ